MTTKMLRRLLPSADQISVCLSPVFVKQLAASIGIKDPTKIDKLRHMLRNAITNYVEEAAQPQPREIRDELTQLIRLLRTIRTRRKDSLTAEDALEVDQAVDGLSPTSKAAITLGFQRIPELTRMKKQWQRISAINTLIGMCHSSAEWRQGRKRPGGRRSRTYQKQLVGPAVRRGRISDGPEFWLLYLIASIYFEFTGRLPARRSFEQGRPRQQEFGLFFTRALEHCGIKTFSWNGEGADWHLRKYLQLVAPVPVRKLPPNT